MKLIIAGAVLVFLAVLSSVVVLGVSFIQHINWRKEHCKCTEWDKQAVYHPPTYVKFGDIIVPVGGGNRIEEVCLNWECKE